MCARTHTLTQTHTHTHKHTHTHTHTHTHICKSHHHNEAVHTCCIQGLCSRKLVQYFSDPGSGLSGRGIELFHLLPAAPYFRPMPQHRLTVDVVEFAVKSDGFLLWRDPLDNDDHACGLKSQLRAAPMTYERTHYYCLYTYLACYVQTMHSWSMVNT